MTTTQKTYLHIIQELENKDVGLVMRTLSDCNTTSRKKKTKRTYADYKALEKSPIS